MTKRIKKPVVKPEARRQWLRRFEEDGESPPQIAKADYYDVRTVRKNIDLAREEREQREARVIVLREALQKHYVDLITFAEKLDSQLTGEDSLPISLRDDRMWSALKEHLPRWPVWKGLDKWDHVHQEMERLEGDIKKRLKDYIRNRAPFGTLAKSSEEELMAAVVAALAFQAKATAQGQSGLDDGSGVKLFPTEKRLSSVHFGPVHIGVLPRGQAEKLQKLLIELKEEVATWEEHDAMRRYFAELERLRRNLRDELAVIILRRVVPGRCRYCPV